MREIMEAFVDVRLEYYERRKDFLSNKLTEEWEKLDNKVMMTTITITMRLHDKHDDDYDIMS